MFAPNNNAHRGDGDAGSGLSGSVSYGLAVTGAGAYRSTSAFLVSGPGSHPIWNRGMVFANNCVQASTFQDLGNPEKSIDIRGNPTYGIYQSSKESKNYFAGQSEYTGELRAYGGKHVVTSEHEDHERVRSGNVWLDDTGEAVVHVNGDTNGLEHVYTLTSVGVPPKDLHVSKEIKDGMFRIAGGPSHGKVSWVIRSRSHGK